MPADRLQRIVGSLETEYRRYESLGDGALSQPVPPGGSSACDRNPIREKSPPTIPQKP